jgi:hypothetical protein
MAKNKPDGKTRKCNSHSMTFISKYGIDNIVYGNYCPYCKIEQLQSAKQELEYKYFKDIDKAEKTRLIRDMMIDRICKVAKIKTQRLTEIEAELIKRLR